MAALAAIVTVPLAGLLAPPSQAHGAPAAAAARTASGLREDEVYVPVTPARIVDSRITVDSLEPAPLPAGEVRPYLVQGAVATDGSIPVPADRPVTAVVLVVTPSPGGEGAALTVAPVDAARDATLTPGVHGAVRARPGRPVTVRGALGVLVSSSATVDLTIDVLGYWIDPSPDLILLTCVEREQLPGEAADRLPAPWTLEGPEPPVAGQDNTACEPSPRDVADEVPTWPDVWERLRRDLTTA